MTGTWSTVALMMGRSIMPMGGEGEQKENGGKHGQDSQALHLPVLLGAGWVGCSYSITSRLPFPTGGIQRVFGCSHRQRWACRLPPGSTAARRPGQPRPL